MSADDAQAEPTMEEILASIRRIISEDDVEEEGEGEVLNLEEDVSEGSSDAPLTPDLAPEPMELGDIAEMSEDPAPPPKLENDDEVIDDGWGIDPSELEDESEEDGLSAADFGLDEDITEEPDVEPEPDPIPETSFAAEPQPAPSGSGLVADATAEATAGALGKLMGSMMTSQGMTLEDLVREMLRPMLKEWLDDNLPQMVEQEVQKELRRISRMAGK